MIDLIKKNALYLAWTGSLVGMLGSLYFSEIANYPPCVLCWYQRIAMYPLVVIIGFAIYKKSRDMLLPAFVLAAIGWIIGLYHNLLYYEILPEAAAPCIAGVSCTTKFIEWFGFVTIPLLAFAGFTGVLILLVIHWKATKPQKEVNNV
ncbi:disulfide bond formation protein B [bacterium]|nr:MAG: disulfide bond formation protein B [bacterium]